MRSTVKCNLRTGPQASKVPLKHAYGERDQSVVSFTLTSCESYPLPPRERTHSRCRSPGARSGWPCWARPGERRPAAEIVLSRLTTFPRPMRRKRLNLSCFSGVMLSIMMTAGLIREKIGSCRGEPIRPCHRSTTSPVALTGRMRQLICVERIQGKSLHSHVASLCSRGGTTARKTTKLRSLNHNGGHLASSKRGCE